MMMQIETELITVERAAALLGCSRTKIYNLHRDGLLELRKLGYRSTRVTQDSVDRLIANPNLMKSRPMPIVPAAAPSTPRRLRSPEAAEYLGISVHSLFRLRTSGEGPPFMRIGQIILYGERDLDAWIAERTRRSTASQQIRNAR
jgi:excisionase family DNA binding protein